MSEVKDEVGALLRRLPDNCTLEDVQYHVYVLEKVRKGIDRVEREGAVAHDDARRRLERWLRE